MSYDLAVWVGPAPASDEDASERFSELSALLEDPPDYEPDPVVVAFADDLLVRHPDITEGGGEDSPWAVGPLKGDIIGSFFYFPMSHSRAEATIPFIVERARAHRLVCFDPQTDRLLTTPGKRRRTLFGRKG